jgi:hypothetical protein
VLLMPQPALEDSSSAIYSPTWNSSSQEQKKYSDFEDEIKVIALNTTSMSTSSNSRQCNRGVQ